jgi:hypothetical protein
MAPQTVTLEDLFFSFTEGDGHQAPLPAAPAEPAAPASTEAAR